MKKEYPECKFYEELYEKMKHNSSPFDKPDRFYVSDTGKIAYYDGIYWLTRDNEGNWNKDYWVEDKVFEGTYDFVAIDKAVADEYGFTEPIENIDYRGLSDELKDFLGINTNL